MMRRTIPTSSIGVTAFVLLSVNALSPHFGSAAAAVMPVYQRAREISAVVDKAASSLKEPITSVRQIESGRFEVRGGACRLEVRVVPYPPKLLRDAPPGPMPFGVIAGEVTCR